MPTPAKPAMRPARPFFSSGPCAKHPGWSCEDLAGAILGRSHRSGAGKARLRAALDQTRALLELPDSWRLAIVPGSDTGAMELAMWSLLGPWPVQVLSFESFGKDWAVDVVDQLGLDAEVLDAPYGELPDLTRVRPDADLVFTWNGTTSGVRVPSAAFIPADRAGLTLCDATSACFAQALDFAKLDVVTFSWQKALGGEAAHGMLALSPRAIERLQTHAPVWPMPKLFRLIKKGRLDEALFAGETINTPSMLCVEDWLCALRWARSIGGPAALRRRADENFASLAAWIGRTPWIDFLAREPATRSNTSVCLKFADPAVSDLPEAGRADFAKRFAAVLEAEEVAFDVGAHRNAPAGLRIWCGATVERDDIEALTPWLEWAWASLGGEAPR